MLCSGMGGRILNTRSDLQDFMGEEAGGRDGCGADLLCHRIYIKLNIELPANVVKSIFQPSKSFHHHGDLFELRVFDVKVFHCYDNLKKVLLLNCHNFRSLWHLPFNAVMHELYPLNCLVHICKMITIFHSRNIYLFCIK